MIGCEDNVLVVSNNLIINKNISTIDYYYDYTPVPILIHTIVYHCINQTTMYPAVVSISFFYVVVKLDVEKKDYNKKGESRKYKGIIIGYCIDLTFISMN